MSPNLGLHWGRVPHVRTHRPKGPPISLLRPAVILALPRKIFSRASVMTSYRSVFVENLLTCQRHDFIPIGVRGIHSLWRKCCIDELVRSLEILAAPAIGCAVSHCAETGSGKQFCHFFNEALSTSLSFSSGLRNGSQLPHLCDCPAGFRPRCRCPRPCDC